MPDKDKRNWPLDLLKSRNKLLQLLNQNVKESDVKEAYFSFAATNDDLHYYFIVKDFIPEGNVNHFKVACRPASDNNSSEVSLTMYEAQLVSDFERWRNYVGEYIEQLEPEQDTIIQGYEGEFFDTVILDEDANIHSYPTEVQLKIDNLCTDTIHLLRSFISSNQYSVTRKLEIESIIESVQDLQDTQTELPKQAVVKKLANIWARIKKVGIKLFAEVKAELFKLVVNDDKESILSNPGNSINSDKAD